MYRGTDDVRLGDTPGVNHAQCEPVGFPRVGHGGSALPVEKLLLGGLLVQQGVGGVALAHRILACREDRRDEEAKRKNK